MSAPGRSEAPTGKEVAVGAKEVRDLAVQSVTELIVEAMKESPYSDTPNSNFIADIGLAIHQPGLNAILADPAHASYAAAFEGVVQWTIRNEYY
jgi:hypothetical protein